MVYGTPYEGSNGHAAMFPILRFRSPGGCALEVQENSEPNCNEQRNLAMKIYIINASHVIYHKEIVYSRSTVLRI